VLNPGSLVTDEEKDWCGRIRTCAVIVTAIPALIIYCGAQAMTVN
jgi:hypothetical protein